MFGCSKNISENVQRRNERLAQGRPETSPVLKFFSEGCHHADRSVHSFQVWHKDVRFFQVTGPDSQPAAYFYLDPYSRPAEKRGGAWMDEVLGRSKLLAPPGESVRLPVAHMVCNQTPPVGDQPSLMTFREVETLFHEFGHALQVGFLRENQGLFISVLGRQKCFGLLVFWGAWVAWVLFFLDRATTTSTTSMT